MGLGGLRTYFQPIGVLLDLPKPGVHFFDFFSHRRCLGVKEYIIIRYQ